MRQLMSSPDRPVWIRKRWTPQKYQVDQFLADDPVGYCWYAEIPTDPDGDTDFAPNAGAAFDHECHLAKRRVFDVVGVQAEAEIG